MNYDLCNYYDYYDKITKINYQIVENLKASKTVAMGRYLVELQQKWGTHATENSQQQIADTC